MEKLGLKILIIDTNEEIIQMLKQTLESEGYSILVCKNSANALQMAMEFLPHLILTELKLQGLDGIEICLEIRAQKELENTRIVVYSEIGDDNSQVAAFNAGADGFIVKPIKPRVLLIRLSAYLRKYAPSQLEHEKIKYRGLRIDRERYLIYKDEQELILPRKEFELLSLLSSSPQKVFTRQEISKLIWGYEVITNRTIDVHIRKLREKLGKGYIKTFKGVGYCLEV